MSTVKSEGLVAGVPWPMIQLPADVFIHSDERPWVQMGEFGGSYVKVLYADKETNTTVFLYQLAPDSSFPMHEHPETLEVGELGIDFFIDLMTAQGADGVGDKH